MSKTWKLTKLSKYRECLERNGKCFYPECSCSLSVSSERKTELGVSLLCTKPLPTISRRTSVKVVRDRKGTASGTP